MADLKLGQLPDRTPVKLSISLPPDLHQALQDYAVAYAKVYGRKEPVAELIPAIVASFLASDRVFSAIRKGKGGERHDS